MRIRVLQLTYHVDRVSCPRKGYEKCFVLIAEKKSPMAQLFVVNAALHSQHLQLPLNLLPKQHLLNLHPRQLLKHL